MILLATVRRIAKNTAFLTASSLIQKLLSLFLVIYITYQLGVEDFGIYSFAFSFVLMFTILGDFGISTWLVRSVSRNLNGASVFLGQSLVLKLILGLVTFLLIMGTMIILNFLDPVQYSFTIIIYVLLAGCSMLLDSLAGLLRGIFSAFQKMEYEFIVNNLYKITLVVLSFAILFLGFGLFELFLVAVFASLINLLSSIFFVLRKFTMPKIDFDFSNYKSVIFASYPFAVLAIFMSIYASVDVTMLSFFRGNVEVGYYSAANRLIFTLGFISSAFMTSLFPVMSSFYGKAKEKLPLLVEKSFKYLLIIVLPIAFGTTLLAGRIISFIYPTTISNDFSPASIALQILVWYSVLSFLNLIFIMVLQSTKYEKNIVKVVVFSVLSNIIFNLFLIPLYGFAGAAFSTVLSEIIFFILAYSQTSKNIHKINILEILYKPLISCLIMVVFIQFFFFLNLVILVIASGAVYFLILFLLKTLDAEDIGIFKKILSKN